MKKMILTLLLCMGLLFSTCTTVQAYSIDDDISVTNITATSAYVDWSAVGTHCTTGVYEGSRITGYDFILGDQTLVSNAMVTSYQLRNIASDTMHIFYINVYYINKWGEAGTYSTMDFFTTGGTGGVNDGDGADANNPNTPSKPSTPSTPSAPSTPSTNARLATPGVAKVEVVDGDAYVSAKNIDPNARKLEWEIYNKKGKLIKREISYYTKDTIYGITGRQVYYARVRAIGQDSDYNDVYSAWSGKKYFVTQPKITTKSNSSHIKTTSVLIKWKKVSGAKDYTVYAKKASSKKWVKVKTTKKTSYKLTKIKGKKLNLRKSDYNFKVVTNAKAGGKKIKSSDKEFYRAYVY